ncbi:MAG: sigma-70 family RNA polymerase sigma factor [Candidatus Nomurabacteria bacterium]|nr:sigma-70 family RNA polymerase sigma factor [Candidatus Nomurabacteria bacterium]
MLSEKKDEEIIVLYKNGEEEVFKSLINRYASPLYNFVARLTDRTSAPDIVQKTFIKVWKNLHNFDSSRASFKTWVFTIAKNTATDFLRKSGSASGGKKSINFSDIEKENNNEENISFSENIPDENLLPDVVLQKLQDSELLNKTLEKLSVYDRTILILHYQEDMTFEEIGKILEKSLNTVKSQHRRAIISLRKMLN